MLPDLRRNARQDDRTRLPGLVVAALGVVFGDIGTSPLYALRECFAGTHPVPVSNANVLGVLSLIFWSLIVTVSIKYLLFVMRADNAGEGGILALVALVRPRARSRGRQALIALGLFGAALLYGDGMITPAISVLSAVEGVSIATRTFEPFVVPVTLAILVGLFLIQRWGTSGIGAIFGPVMIGWFIVIAALGLPSIARAPSVLSAVDPIHAFRFLSTHGLASMFTLGAVVLAITGAEALYADMGHFGRRPIRLAWFGLVLPSLLINYFGQGALLLQHPNFGESPFYRLAPEWALYPLVGIATIATVIASQAVISGAFSLTQQAVQLGYAPRFEIRHTSSVERGQIYVPEINWLLMVATLALVVSFRSSTNLAAAYGMAVSATMAITTVLAFVVAREQWRWGRLRAAVVAVSFLIVDVAFLTANVLKFVHGGWFPLVVAAVIFGIMTTWHTGRQIVLARLTATNVPLDTFFANLTTHPPVRVPGTAVFMTAHGDGAPPILLHHLRHNKALHEHVVLLTVVVLDTPTLGSARELEVHPLGHGFYRAIARYGYMERPDVPRSLLSAHEYGYDWSPDDTTFYLAQLTLLPSDRIGVTAWRDRLFIALSHNARRATTFYHLPLTQVVEIGMQLEL